MATTSFIYHALGLQGYKLLKTEYRKGAVYFHIRRKKGKRRCAICKARWHQLTLDGTFTRTFRAVPIGRRPVFIVLHGHRQACKRCGALKRERFAYAKGKRRYMDGFARYVLDLLRFTNMLFAARLLHTGWDLIKDISRRDLQKRFKQRKLSKVRYIAVDEFAVRKGHRYMTVVLNLETGEILWAEEGKSAEALIPFLKRLKRRRVKLKAVAMDLGGAYQKAVKQVFPNLDIVFDPYHVMALANKALDDTRKDLARALGKQGKSVLKGSKYLLLRGLEHLKPGQIERMMELMEANRPLYMAYLLKEELRRFWDFPSMNMAERFLAGWIGRAVCTQNPHLIKLAATLVEHLDGLLAYFRHRISTGPLEGLNNKIKTLKKQAYGFRDIEYFKLRLYFLHESTYALTG